MDLDSFLKLDESQTICTYLFPSRDYGTCQFGTYEIGASFIQHVHLYASKQGSNMKCTCACLKLLISRLLVE